jgi:hypothetical protein
MMVVNIGAMAVADLVLESLVFEIPEFEKVPDSFLETVFSTTLSTARVTSLKILVMLESASAVEPTTDSSISRSTYSDLRCCDGCIG